MNLWNALLDWFARRRMLRKVPWNTCAWNPSMAAENQLRRELGRHLNIQAEHAVKMATSFLLKARADNDRQIAEMQYRHAYQLQQLDAERAKFRARTGA